MATSNALAAAIRSTPRILSGPCSNSTAMRSSLTCGRRAMSTSVHAPPESGYTFHEPLPENYTLESIKPPKYWAEPADGEFC